MMAVTIENQVVTARTPEGSVSTMSLAEFLRAVAPPRIDTCDFVPLDGTRCIRTRGRVAIHVHETPPRVWRFKWIDERSPAPFGSGAVYGTVRISLPYVIVFAVLEQGQCGTCRLSSMNECFFSNEPVRSLEQRLCFPALLNCSRFDPAEGRPLSWICTQHLRRRASARNRDRNQLLHAELKTLLECLFETGFNYSSEHHEAESWFTASRKADERISSVKAWAQATEADPMCALDIPWLPTNLSVEQIMERIFNNVAGPDPSPRTADDLARIVFHHRDNAEEMKAE